MAVGTGGVDLSWIVVSHESAEDLRLLLPSLARELAALGRAGLRSEVIVADSASRDGSVEVARRLAPDALVLPLPRNCGYGVAVNVAAAAASGRWLVCCNADVLIPTAGFHALPDVLVRAPAEAAVLAPGLREPDGTVQLSVGRHPTLMRLLRGLLAPRARRAFLSVGRHRRGSVDWASGACLLLRADAFRAVDGFDPRFFLYYEDCDLALRLARRGHFTRYEPALTVVHRRPHHARAREAAIDAHVRASRNAYFRTHRPAWEAAVVAALGRLEPLLRPGQPAGATGAAGAAGAAGGAGGAGGGEISAREAGAQA